MILVCSQRTQAGALQRLAQRGRTLPMELPAPKHKPVVAPGSPQVVRLMTPRDHFHRVMDLVARMHGSTFLAIMSKTRMTKHSHARQAAICAVREGYPKISSPHLGKVFGGLDHSTLYHAMRQRGYRERAK